MDIIAGTAGHIDHGKTALIKALTGVDADRLPEEKQRGITIDLGFAELEIGDIRFGFVDVPGHERFIKNMLAGASGIDLVMLVVAADEGVMPQTREHFDICRLLDIKAGLVLLTKKDLADNDTVEIVRLQIRELVAGSFLAGAPVIPVSSKTGEGLDGVRTALARAAREAPKRGKQYIPRLAIDRSFSVKGFGTVVTGTLNSGEIREADEMEILPSGGIVRVRGLQTHGSQMKAAHAGQRTAVNLGGIDHAQVSRGMVLAQKNVLRPTQILDTEVELIADAPRSLRSRQRVRVHIGTAEILARISVLNVSAEIAPGQRDLVQLRLESPTVAIPGERFILRNYSPQMTIAGGVVLDPLAPKHRGRELAEVCTFLTSMERALGIPAKQVRLLIEYSGKYGMSIADLNARTALRPEILNEALKEIVSRREAVSAEAILISTADFETLKAKALEHVDRHHRREPLSKGISKETVREQIAPHVSHEIFRCALTDLERAGKLSSDGDSLRVAGYDASLSPDETVVLDRLRKMYAAAGLGVPKLSEALTEATANTKLNSVQTRKVFQLLIDSGEVVKVTDDLYFSRESISAVKEKLNTFACSTADRTIDVPKFKEIAGVSRKYAIPLLEYFDREKVTRRAGDKRIIL